MHRTLVLRLSLVLILLLLVFAVFWPDRGGLHDKIDGSVTFVDVVYFTMVSVTTVGYGDIVPVTAKTQSLIVRVVRRQHAFSFGNPICASTRATS